MGWTGRANAVFEPGAGHSLHSMSRAEESPQGPAASPEDAGEGVRLLLLVGRLLHRYGAPAHRLEATLVHLARRLGLEGQFFSTPTELLASIGPDGGARTHLMRVEPGDVELERLEAIDGIVRDVEAGLSAREARERAQELASSPARYGLLATLPSFALVSGAAALLFGGTPWEAGASAGIGLLVGLLTSLLTRTVQAGRVVELVATFVAAFAAFAAAAAWPGLRPFLLTLSGIIVLVPGLTLTVAMSELATRNLASGTARLMAAVMVFLEITVGMALAHQAAGLLWEPGATASTGTSLPAWLDPLVIGAAAAALTVLFRAAPRRMGWIFLGCLAAFYGSRVGSLLLGPELGVFVGAFAVTAGSNLYARILRRPATTTLVPGILLLVPGSTGLGSLSSFLEQETLSGVEKAFSMLIIAAAIVAGMHAANALISPRRDL